MIDQRAADTFREAILVLKDAGQTDYAAELALAIARSTTSTEDFFCPSCLRAFSKDPATSGTREAALVRSVALFGEAAPDPNAEGEYEIPICEQCAFRYKRWLDSQRSVALN